MTIAVPLNQAWEHASEEAKRKLSDALLERMTHDLREHQHDWDLQRILWNLYERWLNEYMQDEISAPVLDRLFAAVTKQMPEVERDLLRQVEARVRLYFQTKAAEATTKANLDGS
jgi:hypothetical protein